MVRKYSIHHALKSPDFYTLLIVTFLNVYFLSSSAEIGSTQADDKVVYGNDDRSFVVNSSDPRYQDWAAASAAKVSNQALRPAYGGFLTAIEYAKLKDSSFEVCEGEAFAEEPVAPTCTGFLVDEDVLVTAGHCQFSSFECQTSSWVFDFRHDLIVQGEDLFVDPETVYGCKEVIKQVFDWQNEIDYAVIRLDRKVTDRNFLTIRTEGKLADDAELALIGYPTGLPAIITDSGKIRDNSLDKHFLSNLDSFKGNSGAPVINAVTGNVEGILISGEDDFVFDEAKQCFRINKCADNVNDGCDGEKALRITELASVLKDYLP